MWKTFVDLFRKENVVWINSNEFIVIKFVEMFLLFWNWFVGNENDSIWFDDNWR